MKTFSLALAGALALLAAAAAPAAEMLRIASIQMEVRDTVEENLARILRGIVDAHEAEADLAMFPETALSGFQEAVIAGLDWDALKAAEARIAAAADEQDLFVLYGSVTKSGLPRPFNSAVLVNPDGAEVMRYHKMVPESWFEPGEALAFFEVSGVPCTMIICHDNRYPELVRIPVIAGAQVCFYISYEINSLAGAIGKMENYRAQLIARAAENGVWLVQSNGIGPLEGGGAKSLGHSRAVNPRGVVLEELPGLREGMFVVDVDPEQASRGNAKKSLDIKPLQDWWKQAVEDLMRQGE